MAESSIFDLTESDSARPPPYVPIEPTAPPAITPTPSTLPRTPSNAKHPYMKDYQLRVRSFENPNYKGKVDSGKLAIAGFFYLDNGTIDAVTCWHCGIVLHRWAEFDDAWHEHKLYAPNCFIVKVKDAHTKDSTKDSNKDSTNAVGPDIYELKKKEFNVRAELATVINWFINQGYKLENSEQNTLDRIMIINKLIKIWFLSAPK